MNYIDEYLKLIPLKRIKHRFYVQYKDYVGFASLSPSRSFNFPTEWFKESFLKYLKENNQQTENLRHYSAKMYFVYTSLKKESFN